MTRRLVWIVGALFILLALGRTASAQEGNLLQNGGFEGTFQPHQGNNTVLVASSWIPWWVFQDVDDPDWRNRTPVYAQADAANRVHSGDSAQQYGTDHGTHAAGFYQRVFERTPGEQLRFSIWAQVWSSSYDDECCSIDNGFVDLQVGIDPTGGTNPFSPNVLWSLPEQYYDDWGLLEVEAVAADTTVTVFFYSAPLYPVKHTYVYIDDAELVVFGQTTPPTLTSPSPTVAETEASPSPTDVQTVTPTSPTPATTPSPTSQPTGTVYVVQRGDTLGAIASRLGISVSELVTVNGLSNPDLILVGQQLVIPGTQAVPAAVEGETATYVVQPGDTLSAIALRYDTTVGTLASLNGIVNVDRISVRQVLRVPAASQPATPSPTSQPATPQSVSTTAPTATGGPRTHVVQSGENLFRISLRYDTTIDAIAALNGLADVTRIYVGQVLLIP